MFSVLQVFGRRHPDFSSSTKCYHKINKPVTCPRSQCHQVAKLIKQVPEDLDLSPGLTETDSGEHCKIDLFPQHLTCLNSGVKASHSECTFVQSSTGKKDSISSEKNTSLAFIILST